MTAKALITMRETQWSGSDGGSSNTSSVQLWTEEKTVLTQETMGHDKADYHELSSLFYEVEIDRIVKDVVVFAHRGLVRENKGRGINLSGPSKDKFMLRWGETKRLATPTMDGGTGVHITVEEIRRPKLKK